MAKNTSWAPFTFLWTIENFHVFPSPDAICSPTFVINCMEKTEWKLRLDTYKDKDKLDDWVRCYLSRQKEDDGPKSIEVKFEISVLASDPSLLNKIIQKKKFTKGGASKFQNLVKLEQVFIERRDQFLPNDTLTVQCKMWRTGTNISTSTLCPARSCLLKECNPFIWDVKQFDPYDIEQKRKRTSCLKENTLILTLFLREDGNETYVCIRGEIENCNERRKGIGGEVSVLNKMGKVYVSRNSEGFFTSSETKFDLITVSELLKYRSSLLPNNMLTLRCDFEIACYEPESCNGTSKEVSKIVTKNEDIFEVQEELVFCCSIKKDLKHLYESKSDSDIELKAGDKTFKAHKNILSVRCPMFRRRLEDENTEHLNLGSINANILERLLLYIYTDTVEDLDLKSGVSLYKTAKEFELPSLTKRCVSKLNLSLSEKDEILAFLVNSDREWNVTKNEDILEFQEELVFCCPIKKALKHLYESKSDGDIELKAGDKTFKAHKNILSVRCPMFRRRLEDENTEHLNLGSINANILERLLLYIYTDTVEDLDLKSGVSLYKMAKEFELPSLTKKCVSKLNLSLTEKDEILAFLVNSDREWNSRML